MDKKFTYKHSDGRVTFRRGTFPDYSDEHLHRLETENTPVAAILNALNEFEKKNTPRPIFVSGANRSCGKCPNCGSFTCVIDNEHYCQSCGQLLSGTMLKKSYDIEISRDYIFVTDKRTGERKEVDISRACDVSEMIRAAESTLENLIIDFLNAETQFDEKKTTNAAENGSEDGGNE